MRCGTDKGMQSINTFGTIIKSQVPQLRPRDYPRNVSNESCVLIFAALFKKKRFIISCNLDFYLSWRWPALSDSESELDIRSGCVKFVLRCSSSSKHSRMRQTDSMSSERANRVCELRVSEEESVIRRRKQSFLVKQRASADRQSMTIIEAVLEYHFGNLRTLHGQK